jgi:two-component system, OmpR family, response regulator VicR
MKILVAEDEIIMLKTIELRLKKDGHDVIACKDGKEAMTSVESRLPDLVITDIMMPFFSGLEIIAAVKNNAEKKIPIIILSSMGQENVVLEAFKLGADDFITKPFSPNELSVRVLKYTPIAV